MDPCRGPKLRLHSLSLNRKAVHLECSGAAFDVSPVTGEIGAATGNANPLRISASISPAASGCIAIFPENAPPLRRIERDRYIEAAVRERDRAVAEPAVKFIWSVATQIISGLLKIRAAMIWRYIAGIV